MEPSPSPRAPRRRLRIFARIAEVTTIAIALGALGLWCSVPYTARLAGENPTSTAFIDLRRADAEAAGRPFTLRWQWRPLATISGYLQAAVVNAEDANFYHHDGVDWHALEHAVSSDLSKGTISVGGSTITQQLAKNLYLSPRRSFVRKLREALIAFSLEDHLTKQRILEIYLNVVEWGDGVFGAEAAARTWFHHSAQALTPTEAIRLAIALPNPITRAPNVRDAELTRKAVRLVRLLRMQGMINAAQERTTLDEVGAPDERVLPDRAESAPASPGPAHDEPTAVPPTGEPSAVPSTGEPTAVPPTGEPTAVPPTGEPTAVPSTGEPTATPPAGGPTPKTRLDAEPVQVSKSRREPATPGSAAAEAGSDH